MGKYCDCGNTSPNGEWREGDCRLCWLSNKFSNVATTIKERLENPVNVDDATYKARLAVCNKCENRNANWTCKLCSCHLNIKAKWITESCPERSEEYPNGRWSLEVMKVSSKEGCDCSK